MNYPRIYSLSTVGLLKHFHQNYLIHPLRTDFAGGNGVGKSMIADLIQLIFIPTEDDFKFGTKGINDAKRTIKTIPYNVNEGYAFFNVEVKENLFITIGVCIPTREGSRVKLFTILKQPFDTKRDLMGELAFTKKELPMCGDFLNKDESVLSINNLAKHLKRNKNLFIKHFSNSTDRGIYYTWLFEKEILPINLKYKTNFDVFAKVIQSFSKVKELDITKPHNLKKFLFGEENKKNEDAFKDKKGKIDKLLTDYKTTINEITSIKQKQTFLKELKRFEKLKIRAFYDYKKADLIYSWNELQTTKINFEKKQKEFEDGVEEQNCLLLKQTKINRLCPIAKKQYEEAKNNFDNLNHYQTSYQRNNVISSEITTKNTKISSKQTFIREKLSIIEGNKSTSNQIHDERLPMLDDYISELKIQKEDLDKKVSKIKSVNLLFGIYENAEIANRKYEEQQKKYEAINASLQIELKFYNSIIEAFKHFEKNTFFSWAIEQNQQFSLAQETIIFFFKDLLDKKPTIVESGIQYSLNFESLLKIENYEEDSENNGMWLKLGSIRQFINYKTENQLFDNSDLEESIKRYQEEAEHKKNQIEQKLEELEKIKKGEEYNEELFEYTFDEKIFDFSVIKNLQETEELWVQKQFLFEKKNTIDGEYEKAIGDKRLLKKKKDRLLQEAKQLNEDIQTANKTIEKLENEIKTLDIEKQANEASLIFYKSQVTIDVDEIDLTKQIDFVKESRNVKEKRQQNLDKTKATIKTALAGLKIEELRESIQIIRKNFEEKQRAYKQKHSFYKNNISDLDIDFNKNIDTVAIGVLEKHYNKCKSDYEAEYRNINKNSWHYQIKDNPLVNEQIKNEKYIFNILEGELLGSKIRYLDQITPYLDQANKNRIEFAKLIYNELIEIFELVTDQYDAYKETTNRINNFFREKMISKRFFFTIDFIPTGKFDITWIDKLRFKSFHVYDISELFYDPNQTPEKFLIDFFEKMTGIKLSNISSLLNPQNYFTLKAKLKDNDKVERSGSTGETYAATLLLGIARLSIVQKTKRKGLRFLILEETASLDNANFNTFPDIAKEYGYQLFTMTPKPYGGGEKDEWYLYHLIRGEGNQDLNHPDVPAYFKTNEYRQDLEDYLKSQNR